MGLRRRAVRTWSAPPESRHRVRQAPLVGASPPNTKSALPSPAGGADASGNEGIERPAGSRPLDTVVIEHDLGWVRRGEASDAPTPKWIVLRLKADAAVVLDLVKAAAASGVQAPKAEFQQPAASSANPSPTTQILPLVRECIIFWFGPVCPNRSLKAHAGFAGRFSPT